METIKIFNMDDCTWVAAANLDDAWRAFAEFYGYGTTEADIQRAREDSQGFEPEEVADAELDRMRFIDDQGDPSPETTRTFREQLAVMKGADPDGDRFPCFFATTEY
jgi:hypothetical protein